MRILGALLLMVLFSSLAGKLSAQAVPDTLAPPAGKAALRDSAEVKKWPVPKKAGLLSVILPGAGQVYNHDYWKVPFVYAAIGGMVYAIAWNTDQYQRFQSAYQSALKKQKHEFSDTSLDNPQTLRSLRDAYDKNRQLSYVGLVFVYMLNGMEAFVDAHLRNFDISEDLSLRLRPTVDLDPLSRQPILGLGVRIPLSPYRPPATAR